MKPYGNNPHHSVITLISHIITLAILMIVSGCSTDINAKIDDKGNTKLHEMARKCKLEEVNKLIAAGANVNAKNNDGWTPLANAVGCSSTDITKKLIDSGADVNAKDNRGVTVLSHAVIAVGINGLSPDNVKLILEAGGDVNVTHQGDPLEGDPLEGDQRSAVLVTALVMSEDYCKKNINCLECLETAKLLVASGAKGATEDIDKLKQLEEEATKKH